MKKVLIISYAFHRTEVIGSVRIRALANLLPRFGWDPVILTVKIPGKYESDFNVIETFYENKQKRLKKNLGINNNITVTRNHGFLKCKKKNLLIKYLFFIWKEIFCYPEVETSWYKYAVSAGNKLLKNEKFNAIISSSPSVTSHLIAKKLKCKYELPWIADLRDLWTQNHYYFHTKTRTLIERNLEIKTLKMADALIATTPYSAKELKKLHKKSVNTITNGFSSDEIDDNTIRLTDKFTITYTGSLYQSKRYPIKLFQAVNELIFDRLIDSNDIDIRFYGPKESLLENVIKKYNLEKIANSYGLVDRKTALKIQRESQILLLSLWNHPGEENLCPGKLFDYLSSQRPILAIGGSKGFVKDILEETEAGIFAISIEQIKKFLVDSYQEWKNNGKVSYHGKVSNINKYSHIEMVKKFVEVLNSIT